MQVSLLQTCPLHIKKQQQWSEAAMFYSKNEKNKQIAILIENEYMYKCTLNLFCFRILTL